MSAGTRSRARRRRDTGHRLTHDADVWVASASADGAPYLVPLSFDWDREALLVATSADSTTGRNPGCNQTYFSKRVSSGPPTPTETAKAAPA